MKGGKSTVDDAGYLINDGSATYGYDALGRLELRGQASGKVGLACEDADPTFPEAGDERIEPRSQASGKVVLTCEHADPTFPEAGDEMSSIASPPSLAARARGMWAMRSAACA